MADRPRIDDLIVADDPVDRDPASYGVADLPAGQQQGLMDLIDTFGAARVVWSTPAVDGSIVVQWPTGKMRSTAWLARWDADGEQIGQPEQISEPR